MGDYKQRLSPRLKVNKLKYSGRYKSVDDDPKIR